MRTWAISFFWSNVIILAEVAKWLAAKEILKRFGR